MTIAGHILNPQQLEVLCRKTLSLLERFPVGQWTVKTANRFEENIINYLLIHISSVESSNTVLILSTKLLQKYIRYMLYFQNGPNKWNVKQFCYIRINEFHLFHLFTKPSTARNWPITILIWSTKDGFVSNYSPNQRNVVTVSKGQELIT